MDPLDIFRNSDATYSLLHQLDADGSPVSWNTHLQEALCADPDDPPTSHYSPTCRKHSVQTLTLQQVLVLSSG